MIDTRGQSFDVTVPNNIGSSASIALTNLCGIKNFVNVTGMLSFLRNSHRWLHRKLSKIATSGAVRYENSSKVKTFPFMMTSSNGNIFRVTGHLCGEFTGHR